MLRARWTILATAAVFPRFPPPPRRKSRGAVSGTVRDVQGAAIPAQLSRSSAKPGTRISDVIANHSATSYRQRVAGPLPVQGSMSGFKMLERASLSPTAGAGPGCDRWESGPGCGAAGGH